MNVTKPFRSALDQIGNTPLVHLARLYDGPGNLFAKLEFVQPGGSVKDRPALQIVQDAYENGRLCKKQPVVEMTSGNMGAGLAVVCSLRNNPFIAVMSDGNSPERARMLRGLGAEVILVPQVDGCPGKVTGADIDKAVAVAIKVAKERGAFYVDQFNNPSSVKAHYLSTGPEIFNALNGEVDAFVSVVGSGGTFVGTSRFLKEQDSKIHCATVEAEGCEPLAGKKIMKNQHLLQGTSYGSVPPHWDNSLPDSFWGVSDTEACEYRDLLAKKEGLFVGYSAAANVCGAVKLLKSGKLHAAPNVVTILCDTGLKYS